jgi:transcriptional regulator with XRE-family HTH domain
VRKKSEAAKLLGSRLRQWRKTLPLKSFELAKLIRISQGSLSDIESNKSLLSADTIAKLYQRKDLNIIWLLNGKVPTQKMQHALGREKPCVIDARKTYGEDPALNELIQKLVRTYYRGDAEKKVYLVGFLIGVDPGE